MKRRALLASVGAATTGLLAGCTGTAPGDGSDGSPSATPTDTPTSTPCSTELTSKAFEVQSVECGTGENSADASVDPTGASTADGTTYTVTVTGTIDGSDACHTARLRRVEPVPDDDTLRVVVESHVPESKESSVCSQCIVDIDYRATLEFSCGYYGVVEVVHDGETVAEVPLPE
ncbi:hypothetical protein [Halorarius halobius]|uniref:hypothetical protein n=1 Tax=Halorarius halobius TaxID=2962671 RepID=UPI0020CEFFA3|nr:hypothetical protein [Halorarius halobius]